ncbi:cell wall metabolism sensor histidine kinase WalK [Microbacterium sp. SORGH_AS_0888]|uniref:sensor histidine kinase n=1 Tax=Microbacterium sp. SORGH_AS_0888 TaxID=3041791 RepID=UPI0027D8248A|nr:HAMP domain-containing sensor histidine kinase [Microbacterium sp. SORGH_AS_0888]
MSFTEVPPSPGPGRSRLLARARLTRLFAVPAYLVVGRGRIAVTLQSSLCALVVLFLVLVSVFPLAGDLGPFFVGATLTLAAGFVVALVPWSRISPWALLPVPLLDTFAVALMRLSDPTGGFGILLFVPAVWLSVFFGLTGYLLAVLLLPGAILTTSALAGQPFTYATLVLPLMLVLISTIGILMARRIGVQQLLFERQTRTMGRTLRRAQRQEELLAEVLDTVDFGVIRIAADGTTTITNEAHARLQRSARTADLSSGDRHGVFAADGVTPLPREQIPFARAARGEVFDNQIVWFGTQGARRRALSITARRTLAADGSDTGAVVVSRDVTSELTALRARDSLVSSVSHELRTPLTSIIGYLELAVDDPRIPGPARENLVVAERNASRLLEIVSDILTASSRSEMSADMTISQQDIDLADLVRAAGESWRPAAAERAIHIDLGQVAAAPAYADPLRMRQVVDNLLSNAVKYNRDGGVVTLRTQSDGLVTSLLVSDTGIGLSDESLDRLFERFFRAGDSARSGTGLGLAISRELVRAHGGDISVRSTIGIGTTFTVDLPATAESMDGRATVSNEGARGGWDMP